MRILQEIASLKDVKSIHSIGARSIPKIQRSGHLELYILQREKDRLGKDVFALDKKRVSAKRQLDSINKRIEGLQKEVYAKQEVKTHRSVPTKPLKTIPVSY